MCGRYAIGTSSNELIELLELLDATPFEASYNVAPTQLAPVVYHSRHAGGPVGRVLRWGLVPPWARDDTQGAKMINARSETAGEKPAFRDALERRRVLVPMHGYFEWKREGRERRPHFIQAQDKQLLLAAGLWERHQSESSSAPLFTFTILTCAANQALSPLHERMPVFVPESLQATWLNPERNGAALLPELVEDTRSSLYQHHRVSSAVGSTKSAGPELIVEVPEPQPALL